MGRTLVFVETDELDCSLLTILLQSYRGYPMNCIYRHVGKDGYNESIRKFKTGETPIMIVANLASKDLDLPPVKHVINYDLPKNIDEYVHRINWTGQQGNLGLSTSFFRKSDKKLAKDLKNLLVE